MTEEKEYFFFLLKPGFPRVLFRLFPRILGAWRVIDKNLSCALSGKCKIQAPEPARRTTLPPSGSRDQRRPPIHTSMHAESFPTQRERRDTATAQTILLVKGTFFHLLLSLSPSGSSQLFFPGPLERIKRVTWLAIGPGVCIYLRKIVFGVCVCYFSFFCVAAASQVERTTALHRSCFGWYSSNRVFLNRRRKVL